MMVVSRWNWALVIAILLATASGLCAQTTKQLNIGYVYPGGGCRGTTFEVVVGGQYIKEVTEAYISGDGIQTKIVGWYRPMTQGEAVGLNRKISTFREEEEKKSGKKVSREEAIKALGITDEQLREMAIYQKRRADPRRQPNEQIGEELTVQIKIAPDAKFGDREFRLLTATGMSNPRWFYVGQWPETREKENDIKENSGEENSRKAPVMEERNDVTPNPAVKVKLPMVINGQIFPGDVDRFVFEAKKGTKLVAHCAARALIPYLADAVPGWFQAILHLYDDQGHEVAFADSLGFRHDPVLYYEIPKDGKYVIEVHDSIYRGREDFPYRISIGEIPYITSLFPLGGRAGTPCNVEVKGWNLPVDSVRIDPSFDRGRSIKPVVLEKDNIFSNRVGFIVDTLPEVLEREPNNTPDTAQGVSSSITINGRIDKPGDVDFFKFDGSGVLVAEVYARRLYSPLDSLVCLTDRSGRVVAHNDDFEDRSWPLITHHADSRLLTVSKGAHYISISDVQGRGGADYAYRLYIRPPRPDFELRVTPSSVIAKPGTCVPISVHAFRRDGFDKDIALQLENAPPGFGLGGAWVPEGQDSVRLTLFVPADAPKEPLTLQINGHAKAGRRQLTRIAFPAEAQTQAFILKHIVPTKNWTLRVTGSPAGKPPCKFVDSGVQLPADGTGQLRVLVNDGQDPRELRFELSKPPKGITLEDPVVVGNKLAVPIKCDAEKAEIGLKGNLLFIVLRERTYLKKETKKMVTSKYVIGLFPAMPFEVVKKKR